MTKYLFCGKCNLIREIKDVIENPVYLQGICKKCKSIVSYDKNSTTLDTQGIRNSRIKLKRIFISYAHIDKEYAYKFYQDLKQANLDPWLDKEKILPGQNWPIEIEKAIKQCNFFIPLLSDTSTKKERYVNTELKKAIDVWKKMKSIDIFVIPVRINECNIPKDLKNIQYEDMFPDWKNGLNKILKSIR